MKIQNECPICFSQDTKIVFQAERKDGGRFDYCRDFLKNNRIVQSNIDKNYKLTLKKCIRCQHIYQLYLFSFNDEKLFHESLFNNSNIYLFKDFFENAEIIIRELKIISSIYKFYNILDVGASSGEFCLIAKALNFNPFAYEICKQAIHHLHKNSIQYFDNMQNINRKFHLIRVSHVLSHIHNNPEDLIKKLLFHLEKGGIIYFVDHDAEKTQLDPVFFKPFWHVNIFSNKSLDILLEQNESMMEIKDLPTINNIYLFRAFLKK